MINKIMFSGNVEHSHANSNILPQKAMMVSSNLERNPNKDSISFGTKQKLVTDLCSKPILLVQNTPMQGDIDALAAIIKSSQSALSNNSIIGTVIHSPGKNHSAIGKKPVSVTLNNKESEVEFSPTAIMRRLTPQEVAKNEIGHMLSFLSKNDNFLEILNRVSNNQAKKNAINNAMLLNSINEHCKITLTYARPQLTEFAVDITKNLEKGEIGAVDTVVNFYNFDYKPIDEWFIKDCNINPDNLNAEEKMKIISAYIKKSPENSQYLQQSLFGNLVNDYLDKYLEAIVKAGDITSNAKTFAFFEETLPGNKNLQKIKNIIISNDGNYKEQTVNAMLLEAINERAKYLYDEGETEVKELIEKARKGKLLDVNNLLFPNESAEEYDKLQASLLRDYFKNTLKQDPQKIKELADLSKSYDSASGSAPHLAEMFKKETEDKFRKLMSQFMKATENDACPIELIKGNYEKIVPKVIDLYFDRILNVVPVSYKK